jgi:prepilin-type N-terminal cleavage/methylation domain-containing protein
MSRRSVRRGITLIEVLVVIGILGLLIALLLPAKRQAREAARRNQCMNKMKQLAIGLLNYHDAHRKFPAASNQGNADGVASVWWPAPGSGAETGAIPSIGYTTDAGSTSATAGYSWIVLILPYMDEANLYNAISDASGGFAADAFTRYDVAAVSAGTGPGRNFSITSTSAGSTIARHFAAIELDQLSCPSYAGTPRVAPSQFTGTPAGNPPVAYGFPSASEKLGSPPQSAAITNYVALSATHFPLMQYGLEPNLAATTDVPADAEAPNGMIVPGTGLNMRDCTDGTSKTLMLCETIEPAMNCWYDGTTTWTTGINPNTVGTYPPERTAAQWNNPKGYWSVPAGGATALLVGPAPNKDTAYSPALAGYGATPQFISWGPSSNHSGGVVVHAAIDGSVYNITPDIDPSYYMQIITIAGKEPDALPISIGER